MPTPLIILQISLLSRPSLSPYHRHSNPGVACHPEVRSTFPGPAVDILAVDNKPLGVAHMDADCNTRPPGHLVEETVRGDKELATVKGEDPHHGGQDVGRKVAGHYIYQTL